MRAGIATVNTMSTETHRSIHVADDGRQVLLDHWSQTGGMQPTALVQVLHGLGEHPARYARFAAACNARGYAVFAHNHRGHGENCPANELGHFGDVDGWDLVLSDVQLVRQEIGRRYPDLPLVLLGHSMGSYVAQAFLMHEPGGADALILSGSSLPSRRQLVPGYLIARIIAWHQGRNAKSALLNRMGFGEFNKRFAPGRTDFDWLSCDPAEVDRYVADPLCGADSSNQLWADLTGALLRVRKQGSLRKIPARLPVLITGGVNDPVGGKKGMSLLADAYRRTGHSDVTLKTYADGRHEMFNEINRDEFTTDVLNWIAARIL
jgi:alpha-beta hydrolase superfamily lysophospholipase